MEFVSLRYLYSQAHAAFLYEKQYFLPFFATLVSSDLDSSSELGFDSGTPLGLLGRK